MNLPKISIITITYNSENTLERTIESVINQNYERLEYIIVDGNSTDNTVSIIKRYEKYISKWVSEPDDGISNAFNKGISMATGDIIGIINSDDGLLPNALQGLAASYSSNVDVYRGKVLLWKEDTDTKVEETPSMHFNLIGMNKISHQSTFVTKDAYCKYGAYDENCKYVMDYDLLLRYERAGAKFKYVDKVLAFYSLGGITFTKFTKSRRLETENILRNNGASKIQIWIYRLIKYCKLFIKKIIKKDNLLVIFNKKHVEDNGG